MDLSKGNSGSDDNSERRSEGKRDITKSEQEFLEESVNTDAKRRQLMADILYDRVMHWLANYISNMESNDELNVPVDNEAPCTSATSGTSVLKSKPRNKSAKVKASNASQAHCSKTKTERKKKCNQFKYEAPKPKPKKTKAKKPSKKVAKKPKPVPRSG